MKGTLISSLLLAGMLAGYAGNQHFEYGEAGAQIQTPDTVEMEAAVQQKEAYSVQLQAAMNSIYQNYQEAAAFIPPAYASEQAKETYKQFYSSIEASAERIVSMEAPAGQEAKQALLQKHGSQVIEHCKTVQANVDRGVYGADQLLPFIDQLSERVVAVILP